MLLPAIQYGDWKTVKKRVARVVTKLERGADLAEVMTADGMLDTAATAGLLVIGGIQVGPVPNFHCFAPCGGATATDNVISSAEFISDPRACGVPSANATARRGPRARAHARRRVSWLKSWPHHPIDVHASVFAAVFQRGIDRSRWREM